MNKLIEKSKYKKLKEIIIKMKKFNNFVKIIYKI